MKTYLNTVILLQLTFISFYKKNTNKKTQTSQ